MVAFAHLWPLLWRSNSNAAGIYAVFSFYMLSGFLMTLVLNEKYGFTRAGLVRYFKNRALRIYPPYYAVIFATVFVLYLWMPEGFKLHNNIRIPGGGGVEWFTNLTMVGMRITDKTRLIPPAWSLFIEIVFYCAMGLALSRGFLTVALWFSCSLVFTGYLIYVDAPWVDRYFAIPATSIAFSAGALLYHLKRRHAPPRWMPISAATVCIINFIFWHLAWDDYFIRMHGFYIHITATAFLIFSLSGLKSFGLDRLLGSLSYPVFLCHWLVAGIISNLTGIETGYKLFAVAFLPVVLTAYAIYIVIDRPVNKIRT
jgi:peptidoglycan/LPS O-acetylase OafA/YrhL